MFASIEIRFSSVKQTFIEHLSYDKIFAEFGEHQGKDYKVPDSQSLLFWGDKKQICNSNTMA